MLPAAFLALLWPHLARPEARRVAIAGGLIALITIPIAPAGVPIIAAGSAVILSLVAPRRANGPT
jgi:predicted branched-subunit amino acid permease